jgi:branched-chain amino acid transport system ATP-binding protein
LDDLVLRIRNIETYYGAIMAIKGISLDVPKGRIVAVLGANGAGKTTLLRTISGLLSGQPEKGRIFFEDQDLTGMDAAKIVKMGVIHVPQGREIYPELTTFEHLRLGYHNRKDRDGIKRDLERVYSIFPILHERRNQRAETMSGGEQQMLAIARGLMSRPKVLMLDEPSHGLSPLLVSEIFRTIKDINTEQRIPILLVEQNAKVALSIADYGYVMENGKFVLFDQAQSLMKNDDVTEFYLGTRSYQKVKSYKRKKRWS